MVCGTGMFEIIKVILSYFTTTVLGVEIIKKRIQKIIFPPFFLSVIIITFFHDSNPRTFFYKNFLLS